MKKGIIFKAIGTSILGLAVVFSCAFTSTNKKESVVEATYNQTVQEYYSGINWNSTEATLKTALFNKIKITSAGWSYDGLWDAYATTDRRSDGTLWDIYSDKTKYTIGGSAQGASYQKEGDSYNREHVIPQSSFNKGAPMKSDAHHVLPSDGYVNNRRSAYPHGDVKSATYVSNDGCKLGSSAVSGYTGTVFEPMDQYKGDIARIYFYFVTCYQDKMSSNSFAAFSQNTYPSIKSSLLATYLQWAKDDPVSQKEIDRNNVIYATQGNRNPFIDSPYAIGAIWDSDHASDYGVKGEYTTSGVVVNGISISKSSATVAQGSSSTIYATASDNSEITWTSSNQSAVTLSKYTSDSSEHITINAVGEGTSTITAKATIDDTLYSKTCVITVTEEEEPEIVEGEEQTETITTANLPAKSYPSGETALKDTKRTYKYVNVGDYGNGLQFQGNGGVLYNTDSLGNIENVKITEQSGKSHTNLLIGFGNTQSDALTAAGSGSQLTTSGVSGNNKSYFCIKNGSGAAYLASITVTYVFSSSEPEKTLDEIETEGQTTTFHVGDTFVYDGVCTASYSDDDEITVTPTVDSSDVNMNVAGTYTVNLSYEDEYGSANTSYEITVLDSGDPTPEPSGTWVVSNTAYKTALFGSQYNSAGVSSYTNDWYSTTEGFKVDIVNANNNNNSWSYIKMGNKNNASTGSIATNAVIDKPIGKVTLTVDAITATYVTSVTLLSSDDGSNWDTEGTFDKSTGAKSVTIANPSASLYYKIVVVCSKADGNGPISISKVEFFNASISAATWGERFLANVTCDNGVTPPSTQKWSQMKTQYNDLLQSEKTIILNTNANEDGTTLEQAIARYEEVLTKYSNRTSYPDFLNKGINSNVVKTINNDPTNIIMIVVIVSSMSLLMTAFILLKHKKKQY